MEKAYGEIAGSFKSGGEIRGTHPCMEAAKRSRLAVPTALHSLADHTVYPLVVGGGVALIVGAVAEGVSYWAVAPPVVVLCGVIVVLLERCRPYAATWLEPHGDVAADRQHLVANVAMSQLAILTYDVASHARGATMMQVWPHEWPFAAQFLLGLGIIDFGLYWVHRLSHSVRWLWRLHAIHHGPRRIYWMNGQRRHVLHEAIEGAPGLFVLWLLGAPVGVVACGFATITIHLMLQHGNIAYRAGILRRVFSVAELHRWHHQRLYADVQGNYGALLSVWDALFGSALHKRGDAPPDVGMGDEPDLPLDWLGQHLWPFRRSAARMGAG